MPTLPLHRRLRAGLTVGVALLLLLGALVAPAAAAAPSAPEHSAPDEVAQGYLQACAAACTASDPGAVLAPWLEPASSLARRQVLLARGAARRHVELGHLVDDVRCATDVRAVRVAANAVTAIVRARAVVTTTWHTPDGAVEHEASALDHALTLRKGTSGWHVIRDRCVDTLAPGLLEAGGAGAAQATAAATALERAAAGRRPAPATVTGSVVATGDDQAPLPALQAIYPEAIYYDRAGAVAYADRYALSYNPTYVSFSADCCNYASQCAKAGDMPQIYVAPVWWYNKNGTSSPSDDRWSASWPSCSRQISAWAGRRVSWVSSVSSIGRGDFIYYDWTANGSWDHVAVCVGTNSLGQKIVDAHTTDHYHVYWKLGSSSTKYRFARVFNSW